VPSSNPHACGVYIYTLVYADCVSACLDRDKPVIKKALVELDGPVFNVYQQLRKKWALEDCYRCTLLSDSIFCTCPPLDMLSEQRLYCFSGY
jgi:hypothetical protein